MTHKIQVGSVFGHLTVLREVSRGMKPSGQPYRRFEVVCDCSQKTEKIVSLGNLTSGHTKSCGCRKMLGTLIANTKHGKTKSRVYNIWNKMRARCENKLNNRYEAYGGRGITVCKEWKEPEGFVKFLADMGEPPEGYSLERKDNNKGYSKENCKWASDVEQGRNKRNNKILQYGDRFLPISEWSEITGIPYMTLYYRVERYGWPADEALGFKQRKQP